MSGNDAFEGEMDFLRRPGQDPELAAFAQAMRSALVEPAPPASAARVREMAEAARVSAATIERPQTQNGLPMSSRGSRPRRRLALVARVAVAIAAVPMLFAGLAFAGVNLPGPAASVFEDVGLELPNQEADDDTEGTAKDGDSAGSATGQENSSGKLGHGRTKAKGQAKKKQNKGRALGKDGLAPGQTKEKGKPDSTPSGNSSGSNSGGSGGGGGSGKSQWGSNLGGSSSSSGGGGSANAGGPKK